MLLGGGSHGRGDHMITAVREKQEASRVPTHLHKG